MIRLQIKGVQCGGQTVAWTCPKCKNKGVFYRFSPPHCIACDAVLPNMALLISDLSIRIVYHNYPTHRGQHDNSFCI